MLTATARKGDLSYIQFDPGNGKTSIRLEWPTDQQVQLFDSDIARVMVNFGWAKQPDAAGLEWLRALLDEFASTSTQEVPDDTSGALLNTKIAGENENSHQEGENKKPLDVVDKDAAKAALAAKEAEAKLIAADAAEKAKIAAAEKAAAEAEATKK